jgi:hypothetical protein
VEGFVFWTNTVMENVPIHLNYTARKLTGVADPIIALSVSWLRVANNKIKMVFLANNGSGMGLFLF